MGIGNIGWTEFLVILAIALIFFGPRRLPGIAQAIGKSLREFQKALNEVKSEIAQASRDADARDAITRIPPRPSETATKQRYDVGDSPSPPDTTREAEVVVEEEDEQVEAETDSEVTITPKQPTVTGGAAVAEPSAEQEPSPAAEPTSDEADVSHANPGNSNRS